MYALCVAGAVNMQGFVWKWFMRHINFHSFIQRKSWTTVTQTYGRTHARTHARTHDKLVSSPTIIPWTLRGKSYERNFQIFNNLDLCGLKLKKYAHSKLPQRLNHSRDIKDFNRGKQQLFNYQHNYTEETILSPSVPVSVCVCVCVCLCFSLSLSLSVSFSVCLCLSVYVSLCLCLSLSVSVIISLCLCVSFFVFLCLRVVPVSLSLCLSLSLSLTSPTSLSVFAYLSACLSVCM